MSFVAVAIGSAFVGAVAVGNQISTNKKALKATKAAQKKQETTALNASILKGVKEDAGAKVKIGSPEEEDLKKNSATKGRGSKRTASGSMLGGVSASQLGGLK